MIGWSKPSKLHAMLLSWRFLTLAGSNRLRTGYSCKIQRITASKPSLTMILSGTRIGTTNSWVLGLVEFILAMYLPPDDNMEWVTERARDKAPWRAWAEARIRAARLASITSLKSRTRLRF